MNGGDDELHASPLVQSARQLCKRRVVVLVHELAQHRSSLLVELGARPGGGFG